MSEIGHWVGATTQKHLSRRGFLAACGKVTLGLGMAMGAGALAPRPAHALCCAGTPCPGCSPTPSGNGCPSGCSAVGQTNCCDTGGTGTKHVCYLCFCGGPGNCHCEYDLGGPPC